MDSIIDILVMAGLIIFFVIIGAVMMSKNNHRK